MSTSRQVVVATAGHVDHGKSTLVRALTGTDPDRLTEERRRGMTIDLGFAWARRPWGSVAFVDVPGHERFVTTMLAGVGPVPAAMLVVAADEGWMPQSQEHLDALVALGVRHGLLVVSRSDLMEPELAVSDAKDHLAGTPLAEVPAVAVSAVTGAGMAELTAALDALARRLPDPDPDAAVRMWVDRAFTIRGAGTVVTATLGAGTLAVDDELELHTADGTRRVGVRGLQSLGEPVGRVHGVARVAVNLRGVPREAVARGDVLMTPGAAFPASELDVAVHPAAGPPLQAGIADHLPAELALHVGAAAVPVRVRQLGRDAVRVRLPRPVPLRIGDRAVLRDPGRRAVVAGITVLDVDPPALRRRGAAARRAGELAGMSGVPDAAAELRRRGLVRADALRAMGVPGVRGSGWLLDAALAERLAGRLAAAVERHDRADPLAPGLAAEAARRAVDLPDAKLLTAVLEHASGLRLRDGRVEVAAPAGLPPQLGAGLDALRARLAVDPFAAPDAELLATLGLGVRELAALVRAGELLRLAEGVVVLPGADELALERLRGLAAEFTLSEARQALGTSRRVAVPLLELLARTGRTARNPDGRHRLL